MKSFSPIQLHCQPCEAPCARAARVGSPWALLLASSLASSLAGSLAGCGEADGVAPWAGTLRSGVQAMSEESMNGRVDAALEIADRMLAPGPTSRLRERMNRATRGVSESVLSPITSALDLVGVSALRPTDRAEIEYARASALLVGAARGEEDAPGQLQRADAALERARGAAPGEVRNSAVYNLGTLDLMAAEAVRATIPEIAGSGAPGATAPAGPSSGPSSGPNAPDDEDAPDPLDVARALYLNARSHLVEYLTSEEGEDAAANVELVIRRLRELDEIEKQREQQQQDSQDDSEEGEDGEQDKEDSKDEKQQDENENESEDEQQSDETGDQESEQNPGPEPEKKPEEEPEEKPEAKPEDDAAEDPEENPEEEGDPQEQPKPGEEQIEETTMTQEEFQRLIEQNKEHQKRGEEIRRISARRGKIPAKKDW